MWTWLNALPRRPARGCRLRGAEPGRTRVMLETLEERALPTVTIVRNSAPVGSPITGPAAIQQAVNAAQPGDTILVRADETYTGFTVPAAQTGLTVQKDPNDPAGTALPVVYPATSAPNPGGAGALATGASSVVLVQANNLTLKNLLIEGNNPNLTSGVVVGGQDIDARNGIITDYITVATPITGLTVTGVTVQDVFLRGIEAGTTGGTFTITNNTVRNVLGQAGNSVGIINFDGSGTIQGNTVSNCTVGIATQGSSAPGTTIRANTISGPVEEGVLVVPSDAPAAGTADLVDGNTIQSGAASDTEGIVDYIPAGASTISNNTITGIAVGISVYGGVSGNAVQVTGNTVNNQDIGSSAGVFVTSDQNGTSLGTPNVTVSGGAVRNTTWGVYANAAAANVTVSGLTVDNSSSVTTNTAGVLSNLAPVTVGPGNVFKAVTVGYFLYGSSAAVANRTVGNTAFTGQTDYVVLTNGAMAGQTLDATGASFDGVTGSAATLTQAFAIANKLFDGLSDGASGLVRVRAGQIYVTPNSNSIMRGVALAASGDTVHIASGTYAGDLTTMATTGPNKVLTLAPSGIVTVQGNLTLTPQTTLAASLSSSPNDRLAASASVNLGGAALAATADPAFNPAIGTAITVVDNPSAGATTGTFAGLAEGATVTVNGQAYTVSYTGGTGNDVTLTRLAAAAPAVQSAVVNAGEAQRSVVRSLTVTFTTHVTFAGSPAAAFSLANTTTGSAVTLNAAVNDMGSSTVVTLTFSGTQTVPGAPAGVNPTLIDGNYTLMVLANQVSAGGQAMASSFTFNFYRFFGDVNGDRMVDALDLFQLAGSYGKSSGQAGFIAAFDNNGDGVVDALDLFAFAANFGKRLP